MEIIGHGIDIVNLVEFKRSVERPEPHILYRCFSTVEQQQACTRAEQVTYYAGHFAAKEAVLKALGTGWQDGISFLDIQILDLPTGAPSVKLSNGVADLARELGIVDWKISISHTADYAIASVIAIGKG